MLALLVIASFVYGIALALLMFWLLQTVVQRVKGSQLVKSLLKIAGTFVGAGGVIMVTWKNLNLPQLTGLEHATGIALLASFAGFGVATVSVWWKLRPGTAALFRDFSGDEDLLVLLLVMHYSKPMGDVATFLGISTLAAKRRYLAALRKIT